MTLAPSDVDCEAFDDWADEVRQAAAARDAVILAHNYQHPWIQDVADFVGDSLELSRRAAAVDQPTIVFCGVYFMAETAKILSYDKQVLIPDTRAGCSLASSITADQLRAWKAEHPAAVAIMYVNCYADVKAESDYCCTSANAVKIVEAIAHEKEILFGPDMFLGAHVERVTGRKLHIWMGECHVHAAIDAQDLTRKLNEHPQAELHIHPECGCSSAAQYLLSTGDLPPDRTFVLSTGGMAARARISQSKEFIVATETGMLHRLRAENPRARFIAANDDARCRFMNMITPRKLLATLRTGRFEVAVPADVATRARRAIERMIAIG